MPDDPKDKLLAAASRAIAAGHAPTTRELARDAEVNLAAINYHFQSKDNLIAQALDASTSEELHAWLERELDETLPARDRLIALTHFLARFHHERADTARLLMTLIAFKDMPDGYHARAVKELSKLIGARLFLPAQTPICMLKASTLMASLQYLSLYRHQVDTMIGQTISSPAELKAHVLRLLETMGL